MPEIFVNYRTGDEHNAAVLIDRELSRRFGSEHVFLASKSLELGEDFTKGLPAAVRDSDVLLAVIGSRWLGPPLSDPDDWVRKEILEASDNAVRVVPVLIGRTLPKLSKGDLPHELEWLTDCHYERFDNRTADSDLRRLGDRLRDLVPGLVDVDARPTEVGSQQPSVTMTGTVMAPMHFGSGSQINNFGRGGDSK